MARRQKKVKMNNSLFIIIALYSGTNLMGCDKMGLSIYRLFMFIFSFFSPDIHLNYYNITIFNRQIFALCRFPFLLFKEPLNFGI